MVVAIMAILDAIGVASVMPFLSVVGNPQLVVEDRFLSFLYSHASNFGVDTTEKFLLALGGASFIFILFSAAFRTYAVYAMNRFVQMRQHVLSTRLLLSYLRKPYSFYLRSHSSELSTKILTEVSNVVAYIFQPIVLITANFFVLVCVAMVMILVNPWLALSAAGLFSFLYGCIYLTVKRTLLSLGEQRVLNNKERFVTAGDALTGIKDIKLLGREQRYVERFELPSFRFSMANATHATINQVPKYLIEALGFGGVIAIILFFLNSSGGLGAGSLGNVLPLVGVYAFAAYRMQPSLQAIFSGISNLRYGEAALGSLLEDASAMSLEYARPDDGATRMTFSKSIILNELGFTYAEADRPALSRMNIEIPAGAAVGFVGSTGAGKTTLIDIILGLLTATEGKLIVDGVPLNEGNLRSWQDNLGYVPQNIFLADATVAENIALGLSLDAIDLKRVEECAKLAQLHDFVEQRLPDGYYERVGERGVRLSGGQRQRIGIARALYSEPAVIVFDEATSALDTLTERAVVESISSLSPQKTVIVVAHRLSAVRDCDQIIVLENGQVRAIGSFEDLRTNDAVFKSMSTQS